MKGKITLMTWNVQKASTDFPRDCRFVEVLRYIQKKSVKIIFLSEIASREQGILWIKSRKLFGVLIYGRKQQYFFGMIVLKIWKSKGTKNGYQIGL